MRGTTREVLTIYATVSWLPATPEPVSTCRLLGRAVRSVTANGNNKRKSGRPSIVSQSGICPELTAPLSHSEALGFQEAGKRDWFNCCEQKLMAKEMSRVLYVTMGNICSHLFLIIKIWWKLMLMNNRQGLLPGCLSDMYVSLDSDPEALMTSHLSPGFLSQLAKGNVCGGRAEPLVLMLAEHGNGQKSTLEMHWAQLVVLVN